MSRALSQSGSDQESEHGRMAGGGDERATVEACLDLCGHSREFLKV